VHLCRRGHDRIKEGMLFGTVRLKKRDGTVYGQFLNFHDRNFVLFLKRKQSFH
jgi:hypothetical protein